MTYLVHINPTPGKDDRVVEVEATDFRIENGALILHTANVDKHVDSDYSDYGYHTKGVACFASGIWNYVCPSTTTKPS